jgi:hypothetical protein
VQHNSDDEEDEVEEKKHRFKMHLDGDSDSNESGSEIKRSSREREYGGGEDVANKNTRNEIEEIHKKQQDLFEQKQQKEAQAWDLKYEKYWGNLISADKDYEESIKYSERLIDHIGKFKRTATFYTQLLVNQFHKPTQSISEKIIKPVDLEEGNYKLFTEDDPNSKIYLINKMLFKITTVSIPYHIILLSLIEGRCHSQNWS